VSLAVVDGRDGIVTSRAVEEDRDLAFLTEPDFEQQRPAGFEEQEGATHDALKNTDAKRSAVEGRTRVTLHTPLIRLTKAGIVKLAADLGLDFRLTHSCYDPDPSGRPCAACDSCILRRKGFEEAGVVDPLLS